MDRRKFLTWSTPVIVSVTLPQHAQATSPPPTTPLPILPSISILSDNSIFGCAGLQSPGMVLFTPIIVPRSVSGDTVVGLEVTLSYEVSDSSGVISSQASITVASDANGQARFPSALFDDSAISISMSATVVDPVTGTTVSLAPGFESIDLTSITETC